MSHQIPRPATYRCPHTYAPYIPQNAPHYTFPCHHCCLNQDYHSAVLKIRFHYAPSIEKLNKDIHDIVLQLAIHRGYKYNKPLYQQLQRYESQLEWVEKEQRGSEKMLKDCRDDIRRTEERFERRIRDKEDEMEERRGELRDRPDKHRSLKWKLLSLTADVSDLRDGKVERVKGLKVRLRNGW